MRTPPRSRLPLVVLLVVVGITTVALGFVPMQFFLLGTRAIGAGLGWWPGEATDDDGEAGFATAIGGGAIAVLTVLAMSLAAWLGSRRGFDPRRVALFMFLALLVAWCGLWLLQFWGSGSAWNPWD